MSRKEQIFATTLRINTATPEGRQAVSWLKGRDRKEYPSYSDLITDAFLRFYDDRLFHVGLALNRNITCIIYKYIL